MSEKAEEDYIKLINHLDIHPSEFLMIGNSLKSDVIPVVNLGGYAIHIPFHTTWELERVDTEFHHDRFMKLDNVTEILNYF
jgi:putative hydrolase of the HAD superfamily